MSEDTTVWDSDQGDWRDPVHQGATAAYWYSMALSCAADNHLALASKYADAVDQENNDE